MKHGEQPNCAKPSGFVATAMAALGLLPHSKEDQAEGSVRVHMAPLKTSTPRPKASLNPNQLDEGWYAGFLKPVMRPSVMSGVKSREPGTAARTAGGTEAPDKAEAAVARLTEADRDDRDPEGQDASASGRGDEIEVTSTGSHPSIEYALQPVAAERDASALTEASGAAPAEAAMPEEAPALPQAAAAEPGMGAGAAAAAPAAARPSGKPRWERAERAAQAAQLGGGATLPLSARDAAAQARRNSALVSELRQHLESSGPRPSTYAVRPCMHCPSAVLPLPA